MASYASATPMIRARSGNLLTVDPIRIAHAIDALVMRANDVCDLRVVVDVAEDPLADLGVLLHLPTLLESQWTGLLEQASGKPDLANVVHEAAEVDEFLVVVR